ncbi:MAG: Cna B-type domain-containing protein [Clostridia bacterium]|nr:Cna B-type domain-containing protein [Clostridia bacterium]
MKKTVKTICVLLLSMLFIVGAVIPCYAATESGKISVLLEDKDNNIIDGVNVHICKIADMNNTGYYPSKSFENSGISISGIINAPTEPTAKDITDYIRDNNIESASAITENGKVSFSDLGLGIWLVFCEEDGKYTFNPYFVFLPYESEGKLYYEITSSPKAEDSKPNLINVYVIKKWDDKNNAAKKRPESVTVELLDGEKVISSAVLNEQNGWAHTFTDVSKDGDYSVKEKKVENYTAQYNGDISNGFIVTNSYNGEKLPQTGQLWWPIVIISVAGIAFVLLGIMELGARKNGKKK